MYMYKYKYIKNIYIYSKLLVSSSIFNLVDKYKDYDRVNIAMLDINKVAVEKEYLTEFWGRFH